MESFHLKYRQKLSSSYFLSLASYEVSHLHDTLFEMKTTLKEELDSLMFIKNYVIEDSELSKYLEIIQQIETLILKEIDSTRELIMLIEKRLISDLNNSVYLRFEYVRRSYNDILFNIQKVLTIILIDIRKLNRSA